MHFHASVMVLIFLWTISIPITIYLFWMEQPKLAAVIKVIMSLKLDKNMLFPVLFSPKYSSILFLLEKFIATEN